MASKFALVIANTEYQDASFAKLTAPGLDAEEFAYVLRQPEFAGFDDVQVFINEGEGKTRRAIARFFREGNRDDLLLLYFSGHGIRNDQGKLFLAANDTEMHTLEASAIASDFITYEMNNSRSRRQLLILDCCNSGAFAYGSKSASAIGKSMGIATAFEGSGSGRVVLTATDATQYAWEGDKVIGDTKKSVFTHFLIEGLKGDADLDGDGRINVDELYDYTYDQVVSRTPKQTPGKWSYEQKGDIILRDNLKIRDGVRVQVRPRYVPELKKTLPITNLRRVSLVSVGILGVALIIWIGIMRLGANTSAQATREAATIQAGLIQTAVAINFFSIPNNTPLAPSATDTAMLTQISSDTSTPTPTWTPTPTASSVLSIGSTLISDKDGMILLYVPAGEFTMGSDDGEAYEGPIHPVNLAAFWIDITEVTNAMYAKCDQANACNPPRSTNSETRGNYYDNSEFDNFPVIYVSWNDAQAYCSWANRRLPAEAEWEKAASWDDKNRTKYVYPWGNTFDGAQLNFCDKNCSYHWADKSWDDGYTDTAPVGHYPRGNSRYRVLDMAGNVVEWVSDWYDVYPGGDPNSSPDFGQTHRVLRGGSWFDSDDHVRSADRTWDDPTATSNTVGFRCAMSATP